MRVEEVMTRDVAIGRPEQTGADAARMMWDRDCGCVPVVDSDGDLVGIVTDRDLCMAALMRSSPLHDITLDSVMSRTVQTCRPSDTVDEAERRMSVAQVRRIPIVGGVGQVVGIVSLSDVVRARESSVAGRIFERLAGDVAKTLAAITERRPGSPRASS